MVRASQAPLGSSEVCVGERLSEDAKLAAAPAPARHGDRGLRSTRRGSRRNSVHKCPKTAPRGRFRRSVYTPLSPRPPTTAQPHKCPRTAPRGRFRRSVYTPLSPRPLVRPGRATGPTTSTAPWPRDARTLGPEAHAAAATQPPTHTSSRSQAPLSTYGRRHICAARRSSRRSLP